MKQCDIMKISEEEVAFVSEQESLEKGVSFIRDNSDIKILFVTLGNKGSIAYYKDEKIYCGGSIRSMSLIRREPEIPSVGQS